MFFDSSMMFNYEERKVAPAYDSDGIVVSTARVTDGVLPYETAVKHPAYGGGEMVIVENYRSKSAAAKGHHKWIERMTAKKLPEKLIDCNNSNISQFGLSVGFKQKPLVKNKDWRPT